MRILFLVLLLSWPSVAATQIKWRTTDEVISVKLLPGWRGTDGVHYAALAITLAPGWKTYWRSPGAAGIAPMFSWSGSRNLEAVALHWPVPKVVTTAGQPSLGFDTDFVLPFEIRSGASAQDIQLLMKIDLGVCRDICLPATVKLAGTLPADATAQDPRIKAGFKNRPRIGRGTIQCDFSPLKNGLRLVAQIPASEARAPFVAVEMAGAHGRIWITDASTQLRNGSIFATTDLLTKSGGISLNRAAFRFTVVEPGRATEYFGCAR